MVISLEQRKIKFNLTSNLTCNKSILISRQNPFQATSDFIISPHLEFSSPALEWDTGYPLSSVPKTHKWRLLLSHLSVLLCQVSKDRAC